MVVCEDELRDVVELKSEDNRSKMSFFLRKDTQCNIMHMPIPEVELPGLPNVWNLKCGDVNCIQLECQHEFHASALMVHFLTHNMTCPVCRDGIDSVLNIKSLPYEVQKSFETYKNDVLRRTENEEERMLVHVNMNFTNIMRDWSFIAHVYTAHNDENAFCSHNVTIISSRLRLPTRTEVNSSLTQLQSNCDNENLEIVQAIVADESMIPVFIQNSFVRQLCIMEGRHTSLNVHLHLHHPMLGFTFTTVLPIALDELTNQNTTNFKALYHDGLFIGYVTNKNTISDSALLCHRESMMLWLRIDLMTQCVICQIQDHLSSSMRNEFTVSSPNENFNSRNTVGN